MLWAPKWCLVDLVTQTDCIDVKTVFILIVLKRKGPLNQIIWVLTTIKNPILFCKFLSPLKSRRNGFVFKIYIWISVFSRKKRCENSMLGCREIFKINTAPFFFKHPVWTNFWARQKIGVWKNLGSNQFQRGAPTVWFITQHSFNVQYKSSSYRLDKCLYYCASQWESRLRLSCTVCCLTLDRQLVPSWFVLFLLGKLCCCWIKLKQPPKM